MVHQLRTTLGLFLATYWVIQVLLLRVHLRSLLDVLHVTTRPISIGRSALCSEGDLLCRWPVELTGPITHEGNHRMPLVVVIALPKWLAHHHLVLLAH